MTRGAVPEQSWLLKLRRTPAFCSPTFLLTLRLSVTSCRDWEIRRHHDAGGYGRGRGSQVPPVKKAGKAEGRTVTTVTTLLRGPGAGRLSRITAECVHARVRLVGRGPRTLSSRTSTSTHQSAIKAARITATPARSGRLSRLHPPSAVTVASAAAAVGSC